MFISPSSYFAALVACTALVDAATVKFEKRSTPIASITPAQWDKLNQTVGGRLAGGQPIAKPCYSSYNGNLQVPDAAQCAAVQQGYTQELYIAGLFGGYMNTNWGACQSKGQGCPLNFNAPTSPVDYAPPNNCYQGSISPYYVAAINEKDVQAALAFAKQTGVRLNIKNSGHDYKGRSSTPDSLSIWTHTIQKDPVLVSKFVPDGCKASAGEAVVIGAGQNFNGLYQWAEANNRTVVGGSSRTVGPAGGWIAGGGHSSLTNTLGLGVDNVLQIRAVTPDGKYITANACQNSDMWFALRGGGGSTFGVNIEVTYKVHPRLTLEVAYVRFVSTSLTVFQDFSKLLVQNALQWSTDGWGGYISLGAQGSQANGFILFSPSINHTRALASMKPITDYVGQLGGGVVLNNQVDTVSSFYQAYSTYILPNTEAVGLGIAVGSRLIPRSQFSTADNQAQLLNAMYNAAQLVTYPKRTPQPEQLTYGGPFQILVTCPSGYTVPKGQDTSSVTPVWREAIWHMVVGAGFANEASTTEINDAFKTANSAAQIFRNLLPNSGAYQNEADVFETDPAGSYWGKTNYARLSSIKKKVDPSNILTCWDCIGSSRTDDRFSCYPSID